LIKILLRELAATIPDSYRPGIAASLNNLADVLAVFDRQADADAARDETARLGQQPDS
jgi:hypothetical protein